MTRWLRRDIHTLSLCYRLFIDEKELQREAKRLGVKLDSAMESWYSSATTIFLEMRDDKQCVALVFLGGIKGKTKEQIYALLVHEAVHIWRRHLKYIGERDPSNEFEAYSIQLISQELMISYSKQAARLRGHGKS